VPTVISGPYGYGLGRPLVEDEERYVARAASAARAATGGA
jgi:cytochrome c oxidase subunit 1